MIFTIKNATRQLIAKIIGAIVTTVGLIVLFGWLQDLNTLKTLIPGGAMMKPNVAFCFILLGISLWGFSDSNSQSKKTLIYLARTFAWLPVFIGLTTLGEYVFDINLGIDTWLLTDNPDPAILSKIRMTVMAAIMIPLLSAALLLGQSNVRFGAEFALTSVLVSIAIPIIASLGYLHGYMTPYSNSYSGGMAFHTAITFILFSFGVLLILPLKIETCLKYILSIFAVIISYVIRLLLVTEIGANTLGPFITFYPSIMIVALFGGLGPGLFAVLFAVAIVSIWVYEPIGSFHIATTTQQVTVLLFVFIGVFMSTVAHFYNINRQKLADQVLKLAMRESDERYRSLFESSLDAIFSLDANGHFVTANPSALHLTGRTLEELRSLYFLELCAPDQREAAAQAYRAAFCRQCLTLESALIAKDGSRFELFISGVPAVVDNVVVGVSCIARNITERKQLQEMLNKQKEEEHIRKSARYSRSLIEASLDPLVTISPEGKITDVNLATETVTGRTRAELIGSDFCDYFTEPDKARAGYEQVFSEGSITDYPLSISHTSGRITDVLYNATVYRDEHGGVEGVFASARDVTERKRAELIEQHRQQILQMLADNQPLVKILNAIALSAEALNPDTLCSILLLDNEGKHLRHGAAPSLPNFYNQAIDGLAIGPSVGSCGTASYTGKQVIIEDIKTHPYWTPYADLADQAGLASCWSQPIISAQGEVLGSFAIYHHYPSQPTSSNLAFIENEAILTALAIEKARDFSSLQLAAQVFTHAREGIFITDSDGTIIDVNDTFTQITGYSRDEAIGKNPRILQSDRQRPEFYAEMWKSLLEKDYWFGEIWNQKKSGQVYADLLTISAVRDAIGKTQNYVALFTDITSMKEQQSQLEHIAHFDTLTGLPNRVLLADRLQQAIIQCERRKQSLGIAYLDLDGFKAVNDSYGHEVGDELLVIVAQRMKSALREGDTLSRIGGDEFVAVFVDLENMTECEGVLNRLLKTVDNPILVKNASLKVSASIGITFYPQDGVDADQLIRHADQAMYIAKQAGKNRYHVFDIKQDELIRTHRENFESIQRAFEQCQFILYYQPKVNMRTGKVFGVEALIRWRHPEHGILSPAHFLPVIENHPFSVEIGEWVINTALKQMAKWNALGLDLSISVNVSAFQLQQPDFAHRLSVLLATYPNVSPNNLELEVLESSAMEDIGAVSKVMLDCCDLGVHFALDDFGTGYSSLTHLRHLPADILKIDQTFVRDMLNDPDDLAIVRGVIGLASIFNRKVIAEGVETAEHGSMLLVLGCDIAQGYGIALPMPADELPKWVTNWKSDATWSKAI